MKILTKTKEQIFHPWLIRCLFSQLSWFSLDSYFESWPRVGRWLDDTPWFGGYLKFLLKNTLPWIFYLVVSWNIVIIWIFIIWIFWVIFLPYVAFYKSTYLRRELAWASLMMLTVTTGGDIWTFNLGPTRSLTVAENLVLVFKTWGGCFSKG